MQKHNLYQINSLSILIIYVIDNQSISDKYACTLHQLVGNILTPFGKDIGFGFVNR